MDREFYKPHVHFLPRMHSAEAQFCWSMLHIMALNARAIHCHNINRYQSSSDFLTSLVAEFINSK